MSRILLRPSLQIVVPFVPQLYHDFVKMLCLMGNEDSRAILEQVYRESEEKKLLSGYTGIFPSLDHEEADMEEEEDAGDGSSHHNLHTSPSPMASDMQVCHFHCLCSPPPPFLFVPPLMLSGMDCVRLWAWLR